MTNDDEVELNVIVAASHVALKWLLWKQGHDYKSLAMQCCAKSVEFFDALEQLEDEVAKLSPLTERG